MARLRGPDFISLQVHDLAASRAFYTDVLGFTIDLRFNTPDFVLFDTNSIPFGLSIARVDLDAVAQLGYGVAFWLDCDNVDDLHARLVANGTPIVSPPADGPFGRACTFLDPDGYRITINENPWDRFPLGGTGKV